MCTHRSAFSVFPCKICREELREASRANTHESALFSITSKSLRHPRLKEVQQECALNLAYPALTIQER